MKKLLTFVILMFIFAVTVPAQAAADTARASAGMVTSKSVKQQAKEVDNRAEILQGFLESYNSPMAPYAQTFIDEADKNDIDWKWVPAIAGVESYFGQQIPPASYNGWGYGVYGNNVRRFASWEDGIAVVSSALRSDYMDKWGATNIQQVGSKYAADPRWAVKVQNFVNLLDAYEKKNTKKELSLSL
jgi:hypothetical protein